MSNSCRGLPVYSDFINVYNSSFSPSTVHTKNTALSAYYRRYLYQRLLSVYEFNLPEEWEKNYVLFTLFLWGHFAVFDTRKYGVIAQGGTPAGIGLYYNPVEYLVANPLLSSMPRLKIGRDCEIVRLNADWGGVWDLISYYAEKMALVSESLDINLLNTRASFIFFATDKQQAETYKKMYDRIASGEPMAVIDRKLFNEDGKPMWEMFTQDLKSTYIGEELLADLHRIENLFNTEIGIPNANYEKSERLITDEVNANNDETKAKALLWLENIQEGFERVNKRFGLNCSVKMRFQYENTGEDEKAPQEV